MTREYAIEKALLERLIGSALDPEIIGEAIVFRTDRCPTLMVCGGGPWRSGKYGWFAWWDAGDAGDSWPPVPFGDFLTLLRDPEWRRARALPAPVESDE